MSDAAVRMLDRLIEDFDGSPGELIAIRDEVKQLRPVCLRRKPRRDLED